MNNNKPYEISVWDDVLGYEVEEIRVYDPDEEQGGAPTKSGIEVNGTTYGINMNNSGAGYLSLQKNESGTALVYTEIKEVAHKAELDLENYEVKNCKVKERKIGIIGSSSMTAQHRAMNGKLVQNVNGSNTLTFSMYHKYYDNESGEYVENPFIKLLTNERRVKLRLGNPGDADVEWYDFVIKNVQESSDSKVFNYTCTDLFINELSKNGYNITLDGELENNIGTPKELAERVLEGSGWQVEDGDLIHTFHEEPVYRIVFNSTVTLTPVSKKAGDPPFELKAGDGALAFYSSINARGKELQILCAIDENGKIINNEGLSRDWEVDETGVTVASEHATVMHARQFLAQVSFSDKKSVFPDGVSGKLEPNLRGKRIVRAQETKYDANLGKYVSRYSKKDDPNGIYWCLAETDKSELTVLNNYITNPSHFTHTDGWNVLTKELDDKTKVSFASSYSSGLVRLDDNGEFENINLDKVVNSWIRMDFDSGKTIGNEGLWNYLYDYDKIAKGDTFILGVVYDDVTQASGTNGEDDYTRPPQKVVYGTSLIPSHSIKFFTSKWSGAEDVADQSELTTEKVVGTEEVGKYAGWHFFAFTFNRNLSHKELVEGELRLCFDNGGQTTYYLREAMLFKKYLIRDSEEEINGQQTKVSEVVEDENQANRYLLPGKFTNKPLVLPEYKIYLDGSSNGQDLESMTYLLETKDITKLEEQYTPYYDDTAAARVQVTAKESNRFNILQDIAEAAQCWVKFTIKHNIHTGHIEMDENYKPIKRVSFHQFAGKENSAGFKYGINLKSIQRTIESNQLASKLIVKPNSNEYADAKQCAIGKAPSNPTKEDTLYNFDYYINHDMIKRETWMDDMYGEDTSNGKICYQKRMKEAIENYEEISEQVVYYSTLLSKLESECTVYKEARDSATEARKQALDEITDYCVAYGYNDYLDLVSSQTMKVLINDKEETIANYNGELKPTTTQGLKTFCKKHSFQFAKGSIESYFDHYVADKMIEIDTLSASIYNYDSVLKDDTKLFPNEEDRKTGLAASFEQAEEEYKGLKTKLKEMKAAREAVEQDLFERYGRFIQEGTWISEDYFDNELYYLEATNVSNTSAFPQVSYTINVIDVSRIGGYENIKFAVGDKSYIQDTEFFGWKIVKDENNADRKTPYKEEVVCSEVTRVLDDGSQNTIKVQNYKNQFEDLFQRISATTQQVQYKSGEYQKAANAFTQQGELQNGLLSAALERNTSILQNATNESVAWDNTGITTFNKNSPNLITRIVGGGIMVSNDGGTSWGHAITGEGINANYLCAGSIDVGTINIRAGEGIPFTWDAKGISAYASAYKDANGEIKDWEKFDTSTFVRFDQFGFYGVRKDSQFKPTNNNQIDINNPSTPFGLTWNGFFFRTGEIGNGVTIDSENDFCVVKNRKKRVKIGRIGSEYGIAIYNDNEEAVISQDSTGNLSIAGVITAKAGGYIGGWDIQEEYIGNGDMFLSGTGVPKKVSLAGNEILSCCIYVKNKFSVDMNGNLYASGGKIGGWNIQNGYIGTNDIFLSESGITKSINGVNRDCSVYVNGKFAVTTDGNLYATAGKIGGWTISSNSLSWTNGNATAQLNPSNIGKSGYEVFGITDSNGLYSENGGFYVSGTGILHATNAVISGKITAGPQSKIGPFVVENNRIYIEDYGYSQFGSGIFRTQSDFAGISVDATVGNQSRLFWVYCSETEGHNGVDYKRCGIEIIPTTVSGKLELYFGNEGLKMEPIPNSTTKTRTVMTGQWELPNDYSGNNTFCGMMISPSNNNERTWIRTKGTYGSNSIPKGLDLSTDNSYNDLKGNWYTAGDIINGSDARLKNTIQTFSDNYNIFFDNLIPVTFKYNENQSDRLHSGFIAQQIVESLEFAGLTTQDFAAVCSRDPSDPEAHWGIRYGEFVSLNTWQIQKLKSRVSELEAKIAQLEAKI